jgi:hypothetical protein
MAAIRPWTPEEDQAVRELSAAGTPVRRIASEIGRSKSAVDRRMLALGVLVDRTMTIAATKANVTDAKARRAALEVALLEDAEKLRQQLWRPASVYNFGGKDNTFEERSVIQPSHADQLKIVQAAGAAIDRSLRLSLHDADSGHIEAVGMLDGIAAAIDAAADDIDTEQATR